MRITSRRRCMLIRAVARLSSTCLLLNVSIFVYNVIINVLIRLNLRIIVVINVRVTKVGVPRHRNDRRSSSEFNLHASYFGTCPIGQPVILWAIINPICRWLQRNATLLFPQNVYTIIGRIKNFVRVNRLLTKGNSQNKCVHNNWWTICAWKLLYK